MKKLLLIYNPNSGDKSFRYDIDPCVRVLQEGGYITTVYRTNSPEDADKRIKELTGEKIDAIAVSGGDGSVNRVVNAMKKYGVDAPVGIIPSGTANDFANYLKIPQDYGAAAGVIARERITPIDIGVVNGRYFINVCAAGLFSNISQNIDVNFKNAFGKLAYYVKGVEQIADLTPMKLRISDSKDVYEESVYFFFALNGAGAGGFERLSPGASVNDGLLDFVAVKEAPIHEMALLFFKIIGGDFLSDGRVLFFRDRRIKVEALEDVKNQDMLETDVDGETGPNIPIEIKSLPGALRVFAP
ncbi:MAG: YegS/Rv2252/BmrU family lipid kinase [Clostridiales bacterium]|jgi:YegS/Rv2252/BmrU family lipid kinase|nr:YegS/Rv2252/BmrU family lipid kinase [Clostridiales bacterium]